jgi:hypothetical protein
MGISKPTSVALEDVVAGDLLGEYRTMIRNRPCHVVVLLPSMEAVAARERERKSPGYMCWTLTEPYEGFASATPRVGVWLDTTELSPDESLTTFTLSWRGVGRAQITSSSGTTSDSILMRRRNMRR